MQVAVDSWAALHGASLGRVGAEHSQSSAFRCSTLTVYDNQHVSPLHVLPAACRCLEWDAMGGRPPEEIAVACPGLLLSVGSCYLHGGLSL